MDAKFKHTPGPWHVYKDCPAFPDKPTVIFSEHIEDAIVCSMGDDVPDAEGNALLVAAAPDMLYYHRQIADLAEGWDEHGVTGPKPPLDWESVARVAIDLAAAAIAKAEGRYEEHIANIRKMNEPA